MGNTTGVAPLFGAFRRHLKRQKKRLAPLQLVGKLEDYLTKEFASVILTESGGSVLPIGNYGRAEDKRRIDLALVKGNLSKAVDKKSSSRKDMTIYAMIELKYLCNRRRTSFASADDETSTAFKSLSTKQLGMLPEGDFAGHPVKLLNKKRDIYGVVFASYVRRKEEEGSEAPNENEFIKNTIKCARDNFQTNNFKTPILKEVYSGVPVTVLKGKFLVSLYAGLWRIKYRA